MGSNPRRELTRMRWRVAGSSIAGPRHAKAGEACQDSHRVVVTGSEALIAVVSDGAGSAVHGGAGAALVCEAVAARLDGWVHGSVAGCSRATLLGACRAVVRGVDDARAAAEARIVDGRGSLGDFHATLVGAVVLPRTGGLFFHIGDGAGLAIGDGGARWTLSPPDNGEYADTTYFYTDPDWRSHLRFSLIAPDHDTVFLMSDGVTEVALKGTGEGPEPFMPFFTPIARFLSGADRVSGEEALAATLDSEAIRARIDDDKTLVWASFAGTPR